jgi:5-methylcytosine-specific restriction endonuclease McrA
VSALPWFRLYHRIIDDEKLRLLAFEDRWHFVALCCLKADGLLDEAESDLRQRKIAVKMGIQVRELEEVARRLAEVGLIDAKMNPVAWDELQQRSDSSSERVKRHRQARKDAGLQAQWQPSKALRQSIYDRDGGACVYCASADDLTIDHKVPQKRGGDNSPENLQTACRVCNAKKRDLTHAEYLQRIENPELVTGATARNGYSNALDEDREAEEEEEKKDPPTPKGVQRPDGVSAEVWSDWKRVRKKPITATVLKRMETEAAKVGWTLAQAVTEAAESGWQGFKAEYVKDRAQGGQSRGASMNDIGEEVRRLYGM